MYFTAVKLSSEWIPQLSALAGAPAAEETVNLSAGWRDGGRERALEGFAPTDSEDSPLIRADRDKFPPIKADGIVPAFALQPESRDRLMQ